MLAYTKRRQWHFYVEVCNGKMDNNYNSSRKNISKQWTINVSPSLHIFWMRNYYEFCPHFLWKAPWHYRISCRMLISEVRRRWGPPYLFTTHMLQNKELLLLKQFWSILKWVIQMNRELFRIPFLWFGYIPSLTAILCWPVWMIFILLKSAQTF